MPLSPAAIAPAMPSVKASIVVVDCADTSTAPPAVTLESSMAARVWLVTSLVAAAAPAAMDVRESLPPVAIASAPDPASALIVESSSAWTMTVPAVTTLLVMSASTVRLIVLPEPEPAPPNTELSVLMDATPATVSASIVGAAVAITVTIAASTVEP